MHGKAKADLSPACTERRPQFWAPEGTQVPLTRSPSPLPQRCEQEAVLLL